MQWSVLDWNEAAVRAYSRPSIGAVRMGGWDLYRLYEADIARVASLGRESAGRA
jgi:hypothetical protein